MVGFRSLLAIGLDKGWATQTETSLLKQYGAGERVDLLDNFSFCFATEDREGKPALAEKSTILQMHGVVSIKNRILAPKKILNLDIRKREGALGVT